jgi:hypothetical protein
MFDRSNRAGPLSVEITLAGGRELKGHFVVPRGLALPEVLNSTASFLEFHVAGAHRMFVAKSTIHSIIPLDVQRRDEKLGDQQALGAPSLTSAAATGLTTQ